MTRSPPALPRLGMLIAAVLFGAVALPALGQSGSDDPKPGLILREGCCFIPPTSPLAEQTNPAPQPPPQAVAELPPGGHRRRALAKSGSEDPKSALIQREVCCAVPPTSPPAEQANPAPQPPPQAVAAFPPQPSETPIPMAPSQMAAPPPAVAGTGAAGVPPFAATHLNGEIDSDLEEERGSVIDSLKGALDGRPALHPPMHPPAIGSPVSVPSPSQPVPTVQAANVDARVGGLTASLPWKVLEALSLVFALGIAAAAAYFAIRRRSRVAD